MNRQDMILEKLGSNKLFKTEIRVIWRALIRDNSSKNISIRPMFKVITNSNTIDLPHMTLNLPYLWDLKTCGKVKKIGDFLVFGIDVNKIGISISESALIDVLQRRLSDNYNKGNVGSLLYRRHNTFYNFCKDVLNKKDSDRIDYLGSVNFLNSDIFNDKIIGKAVKLCKTAWNKNKPLLSSSDKVSEDIIPILYYSIPRRECFYLIRGQSEYFWGVDAKLDIRLFSSNSFMRRSVDTISDYRILVDVPRSPIENNVYTF